MGEDDPSVVGDIDDNRAAGALAAVEPIAPVFPPVALLLYG